MNNGIVVDRAAYHFISDRLAAELLVT